ncbi:MAG TPA: hypothetical protein VJT70_00015 [Sphingomicrobium sp.]|nr:hypothetical protein [Sphingomicrobium sp.]
MHRLGLAACAAILAVTPASATHSWGGYHWATGGKGLDVTVNLAITPEWTTAINGAVTDWEKSRVLGLTVRRVTLSDNDRKICRPIPGQVLVCNAAYGQRGWVGLASIWLSNNHISQAITQLNDTYYAFPFYNTPAWRSAVACQEIGHDWGLDHQDENFDNVNLGSCMDYSRAPQGGVYNGFDYGPSNERPNAHDYDQLITTYGHNDGFATAAPLVARGADANSEPAGVSPAEWGTAIRRDAMGRPNVFIKDLGRGQKKITHVLWAVDARVR